MPAETDSSAQTWFVYILRCHDRTYYTGITTDLTRRLDEHNAGLGAKYTRPRRPVVMVYSEPAPSRSAAAGREYRIKKLSPAGKKKLIAAGTWAGIAGSAPDVEQSTAEHRSGE